MDGQNQLGLVRQHGVGADDGQLHDVGGGALNQRVVALALRTAPQAQFG